MQLRCLFSLKKKRPKIIDVESPWEHFFLYVSKQMSPFILMNSLEKKKKELNLFTRKGVPLLLNARAPAKTKA